MTARILALGVVLFAVGVVLASVVGGTHAVGAGIAFVGALLVLGAVAVGVGATVPQIPRMDATDDQMGGEEALPRLRQVDPGSSQALATLRL